MKPQQKPQQHAPAPTEKNEKRKKKTVVILYETRYVQIWKLFHNKTNKNGKKKKKEKKMTILFYLFFYKILQNAVLYCCSMR